MGYFLTALQISSIMEKVTPIHFLGNEFNGYFSNLRDIRNFHTNIHKEH